MQPMSDGMNLDPDMHIQVLGNKLAQSAVREAQMETAIQQLIAENQFLKLPATAPENAGVPQEEEVKEDASSNS